MEVAPIDHFQRGDQLEQKSGGLEVPRDHCNNSSSIESGDDSLLESGSSPRSKHEEDVVKSIRVKTNASPSEANIMSPLATPSSNVSEVQMINNLQNAFIFTKKQALKFIQWYHNAEKAMDKKKPPSASANKLQNQKSKKQKQKELKIERK